MRAVRSTCPMGITGSMVVLGIVLSLATAKSYTPAECGDVNECDQAWVFNAAHKCVDGICVCHPDADFNPATKKCDCRPGFDRNVRECVLSKKETGKRKATSKGNELNNYCNPDITCDSIPNAKCGDEGRCVCQENYGELNSTFCGHLIRHRCHDRVCDAHNSTCNSENICICISRNSKALHASTNKTYCYPTPNQFGDLCDVHLECRTFLGPQGMCKEGRCSCEERFAPSNNVCKQKKDQLGLECNADTDACFLEKDGFSQYVECRNGTCQCKEGYKPSKDKQSCNVGSHCNSDTECTSNAQCFSNSCQSRETYSAVNGTCIRKVGDNCAEDDHCDAVGAKCNRFQQRCECDEGMMATENGTYCYRIPRKHGDWCTRSSDCSDLGENSACVENHCGCRGTSIPHDNVCKRKIETLGAECNPSTDVCYLKKDGDKQHAECVNRVCKCSTGFKESADKLSCNTGALTSASLGSVLFILMAKMFA